MKKKTYQAFIELTNKKWSSRLIEKYARSSKSKSMIKKFADVYNIDLTEIEKPLEEYSSLHEFFTRKLSSGKREIDQRQEVIVSPVDGSIEDIGTITSGSMITVKGKLYSIEEMLGSKEKATNYHNGTFMVIYLSPTNYHRIHSPQTGELVEKWVLGNHSYPVNKHGLKYGKDTLSKNYRQISMLQTNSSTIGIVKVGAMFVNCIEMINKQDQVEKGEEIAYFSFGSTVVLLFEPNKVEVLPTIQTPVAVKMGQAIAIEN